MSPRAWWVLAAVAGAAAAWAWAAADRWAAAFGWLACAAFLVAGWREWSWRRAIRAVAQGLRDPRALEREGASGRELAAAVESVLREVREDLQRARARESHLRELVEALPWGLVELDHRRRAVWVNRPAAALLGVQPEQAADTSAVALFRRHEVDELLDRAERAGEAVRDLELGGVLQVVLWLAWVAVTWLYLWAFGTAPPAERLARVMGYGFAPVGLQIFIAPSGLEIPAALLAFGYTFAAMITGVEAAAGTTRGRAAVSVLAGMAFFAITLGLLGSGHNDFAPGIFSLDPLPISVASQPTE
ncbi:MAG: PAS domain-containing protein [Firmicutes bacterium]|nr:PAS domain-containing protein [Bacillota bacterium]